MKKTLAEILEGPEVEAFMRELVDGHLDQHYLRRRWLHAVAERNTGLAAILESDAIVVTTSKMVGLVVTDEAFGDDRLIRVLREALAAVDDRPLAILILPK